MVLFNGHASEVTCGVVEDKVSRKEIQPHRVDPQPVQAGLNREVWAYANIQVCGTTSCAFGDNS